MKGASLPRERASTQRGSCVIAAWELRHRCVELAFCPCIRTRFSPFEVLFLVGDDVTVDSVEEPC